MNPKTWPLFWRRAFLLTFPVTGPLWMFLFLLAVTAVAAVFPLYMTVEWLHKSMWLRKDGE